MRLEIVGTGGLQPITGMYENFIIWWSSLPESMRRLMTWWLDGPSNEITRISCFIKKALSSIG